MASSPQQRQSVGILGGGQLGRMLVEAANRDPEIETITLDAEGCPASQISRAHMVGSFKSAADIRALADRADILTVEIEHVDTQVLEEISSRAEVHPHWRTIRTIQDKFAQKELLASRGVALPAFAAVSGSPAGEESVIHAAEQVGGFPIMLKARKDAYDGRGNFVVRTKADIQKGLDFLKGRSLYVEKLLDFEMEMAVMVVKVDARSSQDDERAWTKTTLAYPAVETVHKDSICLLTYCPPRGVPASQVEAASELARRAVASFEGRGIFGVEMFLVGGKLLVNEIAPRPHNSGHWTLSAARMSQFSAHMKAVAGHPIWASDLVATQPSIMLNVLGGGTADAHLELYRKAKEVPCTDSYDYGKGKGTPGRKMGHIVVTGVSIDEAESRVAPLLEVAERNRLSANEAKKVAAAAKPAATPPTSIAPTVVPTLKSGHCGIAVTMGSHSDLPVLRPGLEYLAGLGLTPFVTITSAHRTPDAMATFGRALADSGVRVAIAAAGGAAHLPGMLAAHTRLPVVGVPVKPSIGDGTDSLLSIANMPRGCAVACVGVNNSTNAAQLAVRILAAFEPEVAKRFEDALRRQTESVMGAAKQLEEVGWKDFVPPK